MRVLYFAYLVDKLGTGAEDVALTAEMTTVRSLLAHLRTRGGNWATALAEDKVKVLVNRQFATVDSAISERDEVAIVSSARG
jgi:molybdopterin synthase sulfur carrier subunit